MKMKIFSAVQTLLAHPMAVESAERAAAGLQSHGGRGCMGRGSLELYEPSAVHMTARERAAAASGRGRSG